MISGFISPNWKIEDFYNLNYKQATISKEYLYQYKQHGHNLEQIRIFNYFENNVMPISINYIKSNFSQYSHLTAAVNLMLPGDYLPHHGDLYERWKLYHNISDITQIFRGIVMLEDSSLGQILQIGDDTITNWLSGNWYGWYGNTTHAIYNFSKNKRYAIQITGMVV